VIPLSALQQNKQFKESIIYNLTQKLITLDFLKQNYYEKLEKIEMTPNWLKYYLHTSRYLTIFWEFYTI
jgi:hypothetical protein